MLAKVPRPGRSFAGLKRYLLEGAKGGPRDPDRVAFTATRNLMTDDPELATKIMTATAALSVRTQRPVYHLCVSWHPDEQPTEDDMLKVADTTLSDIGLDEHQVLIVGHNDTANRHLHMVINRVHADTGRAWATSHDYRRIETSMRRQAEAMGFVAVPGRFTEKAETQPAPRPTAGEYHLVRRHGRSSVPHWQADLTRPLGQRLQPLFEGAASWADVHQGLDAFGADLVTKGQGLVLTDRARSGYAKLSSLAAGIRAKDLNARFGETYAAYRARSSVPAHEAGQPQSRSRPMVSEMDIVLALHRMGLASTTDIASTAETIARRQAEAPPEVRAKRDLKAVLGEVFGGTGKASAHRRAEPQADHEPSR